jgi:hypothetical protein
MRRECPCAVLAALCLIGLTGKAVALDFSYDAYIDLRVVAPASERGWIDGGLGKLRYGDGDSNAQFADAIAEGRVLFTPELLAVGVVRADGEQPDFVLPLEAFLRYRPVSTSPWRWSVKGGAFFPPFSLENTELGWTSYWTLTPSAINSWFGDELRTIGGEGEIEWRREEGTLAFVASAFGWNDPAGVIMADRGWAMDDRPTALFEDIREPDATLILFHQTPPDSTPIFDEIDNRVGWYGGASWIDTDAWQVQLFRYDNEANASAHDQDYFAWHTSFWDAGFSDQWGEVTLLAQGLMGNTIITPVPGFSSTTDFSAAYALLGWERDQWRIAARADVFRTHNPGSGLLSENGYALTGAVTFLPKDWLRLTAELIYLDSKRDERAVEGLDPQQGQTQAQFSVRVFL